MPAHYCLAHTHLQGGGPYACNTLGDKKDIGACWSLNEWKEPKSVPEPPGTFALW